jgi:2-keto-4-pentenoate hydratase
VHVLDLPITGREEDVVDQLSAWMLISAGDADAVLGHPVAGASWAWRSLSCKTSA